MSKEKRLRIRNSRAEFLICGLGHIITKGTYFSIFDMRGYYLVAYGL